MDCALQPNLRSSRCYRHQPDSECQRVADAIAESLQKEVDTFPIYAQQPIAAFWSMFSNIPPGYRQIAIHGILLRCCLPQLSYVSEVVKGLVRIDPFIILPREVSYGILSYLDAESLSRAAQVSQLWRSLADNDTIWRKMCEQHMNKKCLRCGWGIPMLRRQSPQESAVRTTQRQEENINDRLAFSSLPPASMLPTPVPSRNESMAPSLKKRRISSREKQDVSQGLVPSRLWKDVYKEGFKVGRNWKYGRCKVTVFSGHTDSVMCLQVLGSILATGSYDATIKIWDITTGKLQRNLVGHTAGVRALQFDDAKLVSGSMDKSLKVWNWETGQCMLTLNGHQDSILDLQFHGTIISSASSDKTIRIWRLDDRKCFTLRGHEDWVNALRLDPASRTLLSASDDMTVRLWDLDTRQCIKIFEGHCAQVQRVLFLPRQLGQDRELEPDFALGFSQQMPTANMPEHSTGQGLSNWFSGNSDRPLPPRWILSCGLDNTIRLWDIASGQCLRHLFGHVEGVWVLAADKLRIVSGAGDSKAKVWDIMSGSCEWTLTGHSKAITCISLNDSMICTGSDDGEARLYDFEVDD